MSSTTVEWRMMSGTIWPISLHKKPTKQFSPKSRGNIVDQQNVFQWGETKKDEQTSQWNNLANRFSHIHQIWVNPIPQWVTHIRGTWVTHTHIQWTWLIHIWWMWHIHTHIQWTRLTHIWCDVQMWFAPRFSDPNKCR